MIIQETVEEARERRKNERKERKVQKETIVDKKNDGKLENRGITSKNRNNNGSERSEIRNIQPAVRHQTSTDNNKLSIENSTNMPSESEDEDYDMRALYQEEKKNSKKRDRYNYKVINIAFIPYSYQ